MGEPERYDRVETLVLDQLGHRPLAVLPGAVWPHVGDVIELGHPQRDAVVIGVRLQLPQQDGDRVATVVVLVQDGEPGELIDREPTVESLLEAGAAPVEPPAPRVVLPVEPPGLPGDVVLPSATERSAGGDGSAGAPGARD
jgi:hypothetical protein